MVLFHIKADWSTARMEDGHQFAITAAITGDTEMHQLSVVSWVTLQKVCALINKIAVAF